VKKETTYYGFPIATKTYHSSTTSSTSVSTILTTGSTWVAQQYPPSQQYQPQRLDANIAINGSCAGFAGCSTSEWIFKSLLTAMYHSFNCKVLCYLLV